MNQASAVYTAAPDSNNCLKTRSVCGSNCEQLIVCYCPWLVLVTRTLDSFRSLCSPSVHRLARMSKQEQFRRALPKQSEAQGIDSGDPEEEEAEVSTKPRGPGRRQATRLPARPLHCCCFPGQDPGVAELREAIPSHRPANSGEQWSGGLLSFTSRLRWSLPPWLNLW